MGNQTTYSIIFRVSLGLYFFYNIFTSLRVLAWTLIYLKFRMPIPSIVSTVCPVWLVHKKTHTVNTIEWLLADMDKFIFKFKSRQHTDTFRLYSQCLFWRCPRWLCYFFLWFFEFWSVFGCKREHIGLLNFNPLISLNKLKLLI